MKWNIFQQFLFSFYHFKNVSAFRYQKIGRSIGYVFFMMLIATLPLLVISSIQTNSALQSVNIEKIIDAPDFFIEGGVLKIDQQEPYSSSDQTLIVTDQELEEGSNFSEGVVFSQREILFISNEKIILEFPYALIGLHQASKDQIIDTIQTIQSLKWFILIIFFAMNYLFVTGFKFIEISLLAVIGLIFKNKLKKNVKYLQIWTLSAYAATIPSIVIAWLEYLSISIPYAGLLFWAAGGMILYRTISFIPSPKTVS